MSQNVNVTEEDEGKRVVNGRGDDIGRVIEVEAGTAYVNPDPGLGDRIKATLGWGDNDDEAAYELQSDQIDGITDDEIRLRT